MDSLFSADTPDSLVEEYQNMVKSIHDEMMEKISKAQKKNKIEVVQKLSEEMQNKTDELTAAFQQRQSELLGDPAALYNPELCSIDLDLTVYDGDRDYVIEFNQDPNIQEAYNQLKNNNPVFQSRKHLLKTSLRLTPKLAPGLYEIGAKCRNSLGLRNDIEFYVYQDNAFNAACYPPDENKYYIILTSGILEKFSNDELAFVVGHELGHALFNHHKYPASHILDIGSDYLSPLHAMKLFSWQRNAEISADRVGLLCCQSFEAAASAFFKLSSGVTTDSLNFHLNEYIKQFVDLEEVLSNSEVDPEDWYSSHPFSPLRIKALELFNKSKTFYTLLNKQGGEITEEEMERDIKQILSLMEPSYLSEESETGLMLQKFIFLSGFLISMADGSVDDSEIQALRQLVQPEVFNDVIETIQGKTEDDLKDEIASMSGSMNAVLSPMQKLNILRDLSVISAADEEIVESEVEILYGLAYLLNINSEFIDRVLNDISSME